MRRLRGFLLVSFVVAFASCNPLGHCTPGYDDQVSQVHVCDGNVVVSYSEVCGEKSNEGRVDCSKQGNVCVGGQCVVPCSDDTACSPDTYCSATTSADGRRICAVRLSTDVDCTAQPSACKQDLLCAPKPVWSETDKEKYTSQKYCSEDCTKVDPASQTCPFAASSICDGNSVRTCLCRAPDAASKPCQEGTACLFDDKTGDAFCVLSTEPDPKCGIGSFTSYCDGNAYVSCRGRFAITRVTCSVEQSCTPYGCTAAR
jgi:hypothetical protein